MKYSRNALLRRIELTRAQDVTDSVNVATAQQREWDQSLAEWLSGPAQQLVTIAGEIQNAVRFGLPVVYRDVQRFNGLTFRGNADRPADFDVDSYQPPECLVELSNVLDSVTDDVVSSTTLENAGVLRHVRRLVQLPKD